MGVTLLFDQFARILELVKQQNDIHFIKLQYRLHDKMKTMM